MRIERGKKMWREREGDMKIPSLQNTTPLSPLHSPPTCENIIGVHIQTGDFIP